MGRLIAGRTGSLAPGHRMVQPWRTSESTEVELDSHIEVVLGPTAGGDPDHHPAHRGHPTASSGTNGTGGRRCFDPVRRHFTSA